MKFYTLIHICKDEQSTHNNAGITSFEEQINKYFRCATQLHKSLQHIGIELITVTNDKPFLQKLNKENYPIDVLELDFHLKVPSGVKFYSAHFKIELYNYLASLNEEYIALVDCDIVCINHIPTAFQNCIEHKIPLYYDITDQMSPAFGQNKIIRDKERLSKKSSIGLWAGGEFIAGTPSFFKRLYNEIENIKQFYFENFNSFVHQGDEMLTSVAIENLMLNSDIRIIDAGSLSIIGRVWSPKPLHVQKPLSAYNDHFLLHLPSDKGFINTLNNKELKGEDFFSSYKYHFYKTRLAQSAFKGLIPYLKKGRKKFAK